jgi:ketosteroid isomerase-like protein
MTLPRQEIRALVVKWLEAWNEHDLDAVMNLFHDEVVFENWTGARIKGKRALWRAWKRWFTNHGGFRFIQEDLFVDEVAQSALLRWRLEWPSTTRGYEGKLERREGVDILYLCEGKISRKLTFTKTVVEIDAVPMQLAVNVHTRSGAR